MGWLHDVSCFFGGVLLINAVPHMVSGLTGRPFQTPFAKPPGKGLSSSTVNVFWGFLNLVIGYLLVNKRRTGTPPESGCKVLFSRLETTNR